MLTVRREGHQMSPHTPAGRRAATAALTATALTMPLLVSAPAQAAPCSLPNNVVANCNGTSHTPGSGGGGGGGGTGGGGDSGPVAPPPPEGLTPDEAPGVVQVPGVAAPAPAPPATADLVATARASARFPTVIVHTAPKNKTYVRLRTSLWVEGFKDVQTQPITFGAQKVQLTAKPSSVTWDLGETKDLVCDGAGSKDGKTCHYAYKRSSASQPGGSYKITATIWWDVTWTCEGAECDSPGGSLGRNPVSSAPTPLVVSEIQTNTGQ